MVHGNVKWALDLILYVLDDLFQLFQEFEPVLDDQEAFAQKGKEKFTWPCPFSQWLAY